MTPLKAQALLSLVNDRKRAGGRIRASVYLHRQVWEAFKAACLERHVAPSQVLEAMQLQFLEELGYKPPPTGNSPLPSPFPHSDIVDDSQNE